MNGFGRNLGQVLGFGEPARAHISVAVAIEAPKDLVFGLIRDQAQRGRFLPDDWRFVGCVTPVTDQVGSQMELEMRLGPSVRRLIQLLALDQDHVVEGPPLDGNFVITWTVLDRGDETAVDLAMDFEYGGFLGEMLVKRRLRTAFTQQLLHLGAVAIAERDRR